MVVERWSNKAFVASENFNIRPGSQTQCHSKEEEEEEEEEEEQGEIQKANKQSKKLAQLLDILSKAKP
jgi:hypothetical protein